MDFQRQLQRGRAGELRMMIRLMNENYNHPAPGDSRHNILDETTSKMFQEWGVDLLETWEDKWGEHHELWHEVKSDYAATCAINKTPSPEWAEIASYYYGQPWSIGTGNLFIETRQKKEPGWYELIQSVDPKDHHAENRIIWFVLPAIQEPAPQPWKADQYTIPAILIAAPYRGLIDTVENWRGRRKPRLIQTDTSEGYALPITELWNWTAETRRRAEDMKPVKLEPPQSSTGSGAKLYVCHDIGMMMQAPQEEREAVAKRLMDGLRGETQARTLEALCKRAQAQ